METGQNLQGKTDGIDRGTDDVAKRYPDVYPFMGKECVPLVFRKPFVRAVAFGAIMFLLCFFAATAGPGAKQGKDYAFIFTKDTITDKTKSAITENDTNEDMVADKDSYVDLGLSVKWATCNLGADAPEEFGDYYAWGETKPKDVYANDNYRFKCEKGQKGVSYSKYSEIDGVISLEPHDDAAVAALGYPWRMPTVDEMAELLFDCEWEWTTLNGVKGNKVTGPNGNWIFLPAAGFRTDTFNDFESATYLTSTLEASYLYRSFTLGFWDEHTHITTQERGFGYSIRPVFK